MSSLYFPELNDLIARVRTYIDEPVQANFTNTEITYAINDAQQELGTEITQVNEHYFVNPVPTTFVPVVNPITSLYALATDFFKMARLEIQTSGEMVPFIDLNEKSIDNLGIPPLVNTAGYGAGIQAYILGNDVGITPPPNDPTMIFQYWYEPVLKDLVNPTDTSAIPRVWIDALAMLAAIDMLVKDEDDTSQLERKYARRLDQIKRTARNRQVQNPKYVRRTGFSSPLYPWMV